MDTNFITFFNPRKNSNVGEEKKQEGTCSLQFVSPVRFSQLPHPAIGLRALLLYELPRSFFLRGSADLREG
jgi:hypothetical protein